MPSLRHRLAAAYIHRVRRRRPGLTDDELANDIVNGRKKERFAPPRSLRDRVDVSSDSGFEVYTLSPSGAPAGTRIVYVHGGSYVADLTPEHWRLVARIADESGAEVVVPRYPLAPEATWRTSWDALRELTDRSAMEAEPLPTVLMGDSAGGGLALALAQSLTASGTILAGLVLFAPWVDLTVSDEYGVVNDDPWLDPDVLRACGRLWAGDGPPERPELSSLNGRMAGLPPTLVISGDRDVLHPGHLELMRRLDAAGVQAEVIIGQRLIHVYPLLPGPEAKRARQSVVAFLEKLRNG